MIVLKSQKVQPNKRVVPAFFDPRLVMSVILVMIVRLAKSVILVMFVKFVMFEVYLI